MANRRRNNRRRNNRRRRSNEMNEIWRIWRMLPWKIRRSVETVVFFSVGASVFDTVS